jgi:prolyl-tRNA synthetase
MLWSRTMIPTLREDPQEAEIPSHKLMLRAGLIRKLTGGLYTFLPLGLRCLYKVERIVREEMDRAGALEILMPALQPREIWDRSGRYPVMGDVMFRMRDRQQREMVLGPTHEEVVTALASHEINSYRQLPKTLYQIQTKFRDEIRPRFGLMRAKEFIMKDAYSFDCDWDAADASYRAMYDAYARIFDRCGLKTMVVEADTGAMGGKWSHEFMVLADAGEDAVLHCDTCSYAANVEKAERRQSGPPAPSAGVDAGAAAEEVATPDCRTIEQVSAFFGCEPGRLVKTLIYVADGKPAAIMIPGDRDVNESKVLRAIEAASLTLADDETVQRVTGAPVGFAGPVGLQIPLYADVTLKDARGMIAGANRADAHIRNVDLTRDAKVTAHHDLSNARAGDGCPRCDGRLAEKRGIEVGHVFKLGTKYSVSFDAVYLDENGQRQPLVMGCYGIGVTRTLQAVVEQRHDENGILWPMSVAPYHVVIDVLDPEDATAMGHGRDLQARLEKRGMDVLLDDRSERPGVKFKDADLIGFPIRVVVSRRSLAAGGFEVKLREEKAARSVPIAEAEEAVAELFLNSR